MDRKIKQNQISTENKSRVCCTGICPQKCHSK